MIVAFPFFYSIWGSQDTQMLGETARNVSFSHPFSSVPSTSKIHDLRAVSPYASRLSMGKRTNRSHFAHVHYHPFENHYMAELGLVFLDLSFVNRCLLLSLTESN